MRRAGVFLLVIVVFFPLAATSQDDVETNTSADETSRRLDDASQDLAAIRGQSEAFVAAFNKHDSKAVAAFWTEDGEYIDDTGRRYSGRDAIERVYAEFFAGNPEATLRLAVDSLRLLSSNSAIEDGRASVDPPQPGVPGHGKYTAVHIRVDGQWLMASVRDTHVEKPSAFRNIADLEWLIGTWVAEEHGHKIESACRWMGNKSFVERNYTVTAPDGMRSSGVQLIGWNVLDGHVQSWDFSPDGGHAVGVWTPQEDGWRAEMQGVTGNGVVTSSVNTLRRLDDNAYVWESFDRTAGDVSLPDSDEIVIRRKATQ